MAQLGRPPKRFAYKVFAANVERVETDINNHTSEGWRLHSVTAPNQMGYIVAVMERDAAREENEA